MRAAIDYELIDQCSSQLEKTWEPTADTFPPPVAQLAAFIDIDTFEPTRSNLLKVLIEVDLEKRRRHQLNPLPGDYIVVFPNEVGVESVVRECFQGCAVPPPPPPPPPIIGGYKLGKLLGKGGFGSVYRALNEQTGQDVAIKLAIPSAAGKADSLSMLLGEARTAVHLIHPNIVRVLTVHSDNVVPLAVVMDYVEGGKTLEWWLKERPPQIDFAESAQLIRCVARGLAYAHKDEKNRKGIIHRDIKPGNILLKPIGTPLQNDQSTPMHAVSLGGQWYQPCLTDFGFAVTEVTQKQQRGVIAGSLPYLSPEQTRGETDQLRSSSDVWSLGVIFYELLTGRKPFEGKNIQEVFNEISKRAPQQLRQLNSHVPQRLEELCLGSSGKCSGCLQKRSEDRMTAEDLANALDEWLDGLAWDFSRQRSAAAVSKPDNPYRGLQAFRMSDRDVFCGRRELIENLSVRASRVSLLAVVGASGTGKSSLVQAGFLPKMSQDGWFVVPPIRLFRDPFQNLATGMETAVGLPADELAETYKETPAKFLKDLKQIGKNHKGVVLYIDQFEELLTLSDAKAQANFLTCLLSPWVVNDGWAAECCKLIVTLRNEFVKTAMECDETLQKLLEESEPQLVGQLKEVREVVVRPASQRRVTVNPELVARIVTDVGSDRGNLPLLEFCLTRLWDVQEPGIGDELTLETYEKIGCFRGAITSHADTVLEYLRRKKQADVVRGLFLQLVKVNADDSRHDVRQPRTINYLAGVPGLGGRQSVKDVVNTLTETEVRLLVQDGDIVEIAHEALLHEWKTLSGWIAEEREFLVKCDRIEVCRRHNEIIPDGLLSEATMWLTGRQRDQLSTECRCFIEEGLAQRGRSDAWKLFEAMPELVPEIAKGVRFRDVTREIFRCLLENGRDLEGVPLSPSRRRRAQFAVLLLGGNDLAEQLCADLLHLPPEEFAVLRQSLVSYVGSLTGGLWNTVSDRDNPSGKRLRAACALALFDPDSPDWATIGAEVAELLVRESPHLVQPWSEFLRPMRKYLIPVLKDVFQSRARFDSAARIVAICLLPGYLDDSPNELVELTLDAKPDQLDALLDPLESHCELAINRFKGCLTDPDEPPHRKANAAVGLLRMGGSDSVWPLFDRSDRPDVRTGLIHSAAPARVNPNMLSAAVLSRDLSPGQLAGAIQALGEYPPDVLSKNELESIAARLHHFSSTDSDTEVRASAAWLARIWQLPGSYNPVPGARGKNDGRTAWWVNSAGVVMTVFHGPFVVPMGSPTEEKGREPREIRHDRLLPRSYCIADTPVTVRQFVPFLAECLKFLIKRKLVDQYAIKRYRELCELPAGAAELDRPVTNVSWFVAVAYCNWLSLLEGVSGNGLVYPPVELWPGRVVKMAAARLTRPGYRLPTEAEWEHACRARTATSRFFGESSMWLKKYSWFQENSQKSLAPVGMVKPNPNGLFDLYGNALEWCENKHIHYDKMSSKRKATDLVDVTTVVEKSTRVLKGAPFKSDDDWCRTAYRHFFSPEVEQMTAGLRLVRTWTVELEGGT